MSLLISEVGNNHFGSMKLAKELIRISHESGADIVKGQAFKADDIKTGSMGQGFYEQCEFSEEQYIELIDYARSIHTDMFYSIFSPGFEKLRAVQKWHKLSAAQTAAGGVRIGSDTAWQVISFPRSMIEAKRVPRLRRAWVLYATEYMPTDPRIDMLERLGDQIGGPVGLSDHSVGVSTCIKAVQIYGVNAIEKHFTLQKNMSWGGQVFRDTVHGATPSEMEVIANAMKGNA